MPDQPKGVFDSLKSEVATLNAIVSDLENALKSAEQAAKKEIIYKKEK